MAPRTRSAASGGPTLRSHVRQPEQPEIISIDEDEDEAMDEDEDVYENEEELVDDITEELEGDGIDEEMADVNGDHPEEPAFPVLEPSLKSVMGSARKLQGSPQLFTAAGAQEALHPLRRTADRVVRQIEAFADKLDQFKRKNSTDEFQRIQAAYTLVESYRDYAQNAIQDLEKQNTLKRAKAGRKSTGDDSAAIEESGRIETLKLEADTWRLLLNLISVDDPASRASFKQGQQTAFQNLHRYSSDREIWEQFIGADQYALECVLAMKWLEETAKGNTKEIDSIIQESLERSERGQGLWSHGWLFTKEQIKGHKRLRAWPQPLEPSDPGVTRALLSRRDQHPLVTQLDPDARIRQSNLLEDQDAEYEKSAWATCWKMLRLGENWSTIREWAEGHLENWRAVSLCGSSVDSAASNASHIRTPVDDGMTRLMNSNSVESWRIACAALTRDPNTSEYERAVYALLCGESEPATAACKTSDDFLYVYFNRVVLSRYQGFCKQFQRKLSQSPTTPVVFHPEPAGHADLEKYLGYLRGHAVVGEQARDPFRALQATILSKSYNSYFSALAHAVSQVYIPSRDEISIVPSLPHSQNDPSIVRVAEDEDALKTASHIFLIARSIGYTRSDAQFFEVASVVVAGYIVALKERQLYELIPLYASLLPLSMCYEVVPKILVEITDPKDRKQHIRLMQKHGIDIDAVMEAQWTWLSNQVPSVQHSRSLVGYSRVVQRPDGSRVLVPPKKDLVANVPEWLDDQLISSLEWLRAAGGKWNRICELGAWLYRKFFAAGNVFATRELSRRMPLPSVSQETFGFDIFEFPVLDQMLPEKDNSVPSSPSKSKRNSLHRRSLSSNNGLLSNEEAYQKALRMYHLETLALGFDSLEKFAHVYDRMSKTKRRRDSGSVQEDLRDLTALLEDVESHVGLIVEEWLPTVEDAAEEQDFAYIRRTYIPDLILDYHNVLYYASHALDEPNLLAQCMAVATWVANTPHITRSFTEAERMAELVDALALASKAMVLTDPKNDHVFDDGRTLGIWRVSASEEEEVDSQELRTR